MDPKFEKWFTDDSDKGSGIFHRDWEVWQATLEAYGVKEMIERCNEALARVEEES